MRSVRATRASRSPQTDRISEAHSARNSRTANTSPKVARRAGELLTATPSFGARVSARERSSWLPNEIVAEKRTCCGLSVTDGTHLAEWVIYDYWCVELPRSGTSYAR